jgi:hypothetical protein
MRRRKPRVEPIAASAGTIRRPSLKRFRSRVKPKCETGSSIDRATSTLRKSRRAATPHVSFASSLLFAPSHGDQRWMPSDDPTRSKYPVPPANSLRVSSRDGAPSDRRTVASSDPRSGVSLLASEPIRILIRLERQALRAAPRRLRRNERPTGGLRSEHHERLFCSTP